MYILYSKLIDRYYIGYSKNPDRRLFFHNKGKSGNSKSFTKRAKDWQIVYKKRFESEKCARDFEREVKKMKSRKYIESLIANAR